MPQLSLFESNETVLADDALGRIAYTPHWVDAPTARAWFAELRQTVPWRSERRMMYDREVDVPRLMGHYRLDPPPEGTPAAIVQAAARIIETTGVPFTAVGLNFYRDGRDSVAPHNDHLNEIHEGFPIGLVSLGSIRRMTIRAKLPPRRVMHLDLAPGSLLMMSYETQLHYTHGVPKTAEPVGERISLAFRVKPPRAAAGAGRSEIYR
jgi:alkylated DNA repair dioxygenase AlkB